MPSGQVNKKELRKKIMQLLIDLEDDDADIPSDIFEFLDKDSRRIMLCGYVLIISKALE